MKISAKILIPNLLSLSVVAAALLYLVYQLHEDGIRMKHVVAQTEATSRIANRLGQIEREIVVELLSLRYDRSSERLEILMQEEREHNEAIQNLRHLIESMTGARLLADYQESRSRSTRIREELVSAAMGGQEEDVTRLHRRWLLKNEQARARLNDLIAYKAMRMQRLLDDAERRREQTSGWVFLIAVFACGAIVTSSFYYGRAIARPIVALTQVSERIARGEVNTRITGPGRQDEIGLLGQAFNRMADRLVSANAELERKVELRTAELAESNVALRSSLAELHRMQESLMQSERLAAIGQMVTGLSHESRNALQRSLACLEMLGKRLKDNEAALRLLHEARKAQSDLQQVYEGVRQYAGPLNLERTTSNVAEAWRNAWEQTALAREGRVADLVEEMDGVALYCPVDRFRLEQVFRNLMENSLAACPDPVRITVRCGDGSLEGRPALAIRVSDNGPGVNETELQRIFEPFFTTKTKGTGLGMSIVKRIVEAHEGQVEAGASEDRGLAVTLIIPREVV
ncbi:MAG: ATP-binding protein [FCB group bacterium]|jgi:signal transduction histidine kinase|nr:ATP-binding protein [FCB group bacterium]